MKYNLAEFSVTQLKQIIALKEQLAGLQQELADLLGTPAAAAAPTLKSKSLRRAHAAAPAATQGGKRKLSAAVRARMSAAAKARWAKAKSA